MTYTKLFKVKGGHSYWLENTADGRILVADDSIRSNIDPTTTDDGAIFLDRSNPMVMHLWDGKLDVRVPCLGTFVVGVSMEEAWALIDGLGMKIISTLPSCYMNVFNKMEAL